MIRSLHPYKQNNAANPSPFIHSLSSAGHPSATINRYGMCILDALEAKTAAVSATETRLALLIRRKRQRLIDYRPILTTIRDNPSTHGQVFSVRGAARPANIAKADLYSNSLGD